MVLDVLPILVALILIASIILMWNLVRRFIISKINHIIDDSIEMMDYHQIKPHKLF